MNACIRAVVRSCIYHGITPFGIYDGYNGMISNNIVPMKYRDVSNILQSGGTILGTSRIIPPMRNKQIDKIVENFHRSGMDALITVGGEDTLKIALDLHKNHSLPIL